MRWLDGITDSVDMGLGRLAVGDGQGGLACCGSWGHKELDTTERLNCTFQFSLVAQSCLTLCNPLVCSMLGFPVLHQLPEVAQTHVHQVSDGIQPSHPLSSSSSAFNVSQHQDLF